MIDIKELRVGAHVEYGGKRCLVTWIFGKAVDLRIGSDNKTISGASIDPIPITTELLRELGFTPDGTPFEEWHTELDGYPIRVMQGYSNRAEQEWSVHIDSWDYDTIGSADVAYLHQLEGIIYLCTNEELIKEG